jgi:hypothetical protein
VGARPRRGGGRGADGGGGDEAAGRGGGRRRCRGADAPRRQLRRRARPPRGPKPLLGAGAGRRVACWRSLNLHGGVGAGREQGQIGTGPGSGARGVWGGKGKGTTKATRPRRDAPHPGARAAAQGGRKTPGRPPRPHSRSRGAASRRAPAQRKLRVRHHAVAGRGPRGAGRCPRRGGAVPAGDLRAARGPRGRLDGLPDAHALRRTPAPQARTFAAAGSQQIKLVRGSGAGAGTAPGAPRQWGLTGARELAPRRGAGRRRSGCGPRPRTRARAPPLPRPRAPRRSPTRRSASAAPPSRWRRWCGRWRPRRGSWTRCRTSCARCVRWGRGFGGGCAAPRCTGAARRGAKLRARGRAPHQQRPARGAAAAAAAAVAAAASGAAVKPRCSPRLPQTSHPDGGRV